MDERAGFAPGASLRAVLGELDEAELAEAARAVTPGEALRLAGSWQLDRRAAQTPPPGGWLTWLVMAGRGFGKTRTGAETAQAAALSQPGARIALVAPTMADARAVMVEGQSGLLAVARPEDRPRYLRSQNLLVWPNGARATLYSAEEPDRLRGPQFHFAWGDEIAVWRDGLKVWRNLQMALRLGLIPRAVLTTTPRPVELVRLLVGQAGDGSGRVALTRGRTADNAAFLPAAFLEAMAEEHGGTRLGRQELDGELIEDVEGALWTREMVEAARVAGLGRRDTLTRPLSDDIESPLPQAGEGFKRVVVGVDPPASSSGDACGIIVAALLADGTAAVLADRSVERPSPERWAAAVVAAADAFGADRVVAEANNGGDMVVSTLRAADANLPVTKVHAARGKAARAEPVAALYARGKVAHWGMFARLEDELCGLVTGGVYAGPGRSPDRADALVYALTELLLGARKAGPRVRAI